MPKLKEQSQVEDETGAMEDSSVQRESETAKTDEHGASNLDAKIIYAVHAARDKKAIEPVLLDLRAVASFTDHFLILSGTNTRHVQAIADGIVGTLKANGVRANRVEGYSGAEWVLVDYGSFIVHVFEAKARAFYDLERLWRDATRVTLPADEMTAVESSLNNER